MSATTIWVTNPIQPMAPLVQHGEVLKALSQLTSVVVGGAIAKATSDMSNEPVARVEKCIELAVAECAKEATPKAAQQLQRKLGSLESLRTLSKLFNEIEFDDD